MKNKYLIVMDKVLQSATIAWTKSSISGFVHVVDINMLLNTNLKTLIVCCNKAITINFIKGI